MKKVICSAGSTELVLPQHIVHSILKCLRAKFHTSLIEQALSEDDLGRKIEFFECECYKGVSTFELNCTIHRLKYTYGTRNMMKNYYVKFPEATVWRSP